MNGDMDRAYAVVGSIENVANLGGARSRIDEMRCEKNEYV